MKPHEFDAAFDAGEDITATLDLSKASRPALETHRVNVDFPGWVVTALDSHAKHLGVTRQSLIKLWIAEKVGSGEGQ